jgi:hypothetical protein
MHHANIRQRVSRRQLEVQDNDCIRLAVIFSCIDLLPFVYIVLPIPAHVYESPLYEKFGSRINQTQKQNQTWPQVFANCSYQQNSSGNYSIVCHPAVEPVSIFFLTVAFVFALALLLFNLVTMNRKLTQKELIIRTTIHMIYALIIFTTVFTYTVTRNWCSSCRLFISLCTIPILTTVCMAYNWYGGNETVIRQRRRPSDSQSFQLELYDSRRIVSNQPSLSPPRRPCGDNTDPQLENEFNDWLETQRHQN